MEKIIIYNVADARKIITMAANMRIKSIVIDNTKLSDTLENVLAYSQDYRTDDIMPFINKDKSIVIFCDVTPVSYTHLSMKKSPVYPLSFSG